VKVHIKKQRVYHLYNGDEVKEGDKVSFINSDGVECVGKIQGDVNNHGRLFFWNNQFDITDYRNARLVMD
jgi:hypothetical protein